MMNKGRVLVVDDLKDWREMVGDLLREAGYVVDSAADSAQAMWLLRQHPYHVAIVDLRLDEQDETNRDGLTLAANMKSDMPELAVIMLTAYADLTSAKEALVPQGNGKSIAFDFLEKHETTKLLERIQLAFDNAVRANPRLEIDPEPEFSWLRLQDRIECLQALDPEAARVEIVDLLQRVFHQAERIAVKCMEKGHSSGAALLVTPAVGGTTQADVVIKFNSRERAERESQNYTRYVENYIGEARRTQQLSYRGTRRLGAIVYSFLGADAARLERLGDIYRQRDARSLARLIDNLFMETCHKWYTSTQTANSLPVSLKASYQEWLHLNTAKVTSALQQLVHSDAGGPIFFVDSRHRQRSAIALQGSGTSLPNPLSLWQAAFAYSGIFCYCHGDLHERNILVDHHDETWLIDFYQTGPAHPARDFAMLESAIKLYLQDSPASLAVLCEWETALLDVDALGSKPKLKTRLAGDAELTKATELLFRVRSCLGSILPEMTLRDYETALYFHALKAMTLEKKLTRLQRQHALLSASLLADRLHAS